MVTLNPFRAWRRKQTRDRRFHVHEVMKPKLAALPLEPYPARRAHGFDAPVIVSLTSYPARFDVLPLTLKALLVQTVASDATILWLTEDDKAQLPESVLELQAVGLTIETCPELRSYKKLIPARAAFPEAHIVTADDDIYFDPTWLEDLIAGHDGRTLPCTRAHEIRLDRSGQVRPYVKWNRKLRKGRESPLVFPTSGAGAMYSPETLHEDFAREDLFKELAPFTDDVWLYWMMRLQGVNAKKLPDEFQLVEWPGSQDTSLKSTNLHGEGNDQAVRNLTRHYGFPK